MEKQQQSHEFTAQDYLEKIKESVQIKSNVDTKFYTNETGMDTTVTVQDLSKKKKTSLYWKGCKDSQYKVVQNVTTAKILIEDCHNTVFYLNGPITTSVLEIWRCNNCTVNIDIEIFTLQADLCDHLTINYTHKIQLGSIVQAGVNYLRVNFKDYDNLSFDSGFNLLKDDPKYKDNELPLNEKTDQFITRFIEGTLLTELILRDSKGFFTTEREKVEFESKKEQNDQATEEAIRKMIKLAGPAIGLTEEKIAGKSIESEEQAKKEASSNRKKTAGNRAFTQGKFDQALKFYTEAIDIWPENHLLYSNRSATYLELKIYDKALQDAEKCIELSKDFPKGYFRKGQILLELNRKEEALTAIIQARDLVPKDEEILVLLEKIKSI
jgi:tetratricopeptide (TPR) repeat protein